MGVTALSLAGRRAIRTRANLPAWGVWHAEAALDAEVTLSGQVDLVLNDLTLTGTVLAGGPAHGRSDYLIVGGRGRLGATLARKSYANDAGVKVATVVGDALREAGEDFDAATATAAPALAGARLGPAWTRPEDLACRVLEQVAPAGWYVGEDGVVRLGARAATTYTAPHTSVTPVDRARQRLTIAAEQLATLVPGVVVDGIAAVDVVHTADADAGLRTTIYGAGVTASSKLLDSFRRLLEQLDPDRKFRAPYEYRVVQQAGERLDLQPVLVSSGMPDLRRVPMRPGIAGAKSTLTPGARVVVEWLNGDPARPFVSSFEEADGQGFLPVSTTIRATSAVAMDAAAVNLGAAALPVARSGDATGSGVVVTSQTKVRA